MHYAAKPFGKAGHTDNALIDRILNSCLIADCVSCIQIVSDKFSANLIFGHLSINLYAADIGYGYYQSGIAKRLLFTYLSSNYDIIFQIKFILIF